MKYLIIEDEPNSRLFLQDIMAHYFAEWKLLGVCSSVSESITAIQQLQPDLVMLDIEIGEGNGFDVLNAFENPEFRVIFITGYDHYSLKAIKYAALDYLLKPLNIEELRSSLLRFEQQYTGPDPRLGIARNSVAAGKPKHLVIPSGKSYLVVQFDDITHLSAEGRYVYFHLTDNSKVMASHAIGYYEQLLEGSQFIRVHKSYMVNLDKVSRIITQPALQLELQNKARVEVAIRRKEQVLSALKSGNLA